MIVTNVLLPSQGLPPLGGFFFGEVTIKKALASLRTKIRSESSTTQLYRFLDLSLEYLRLDHARIEVLSAILIENGQNESTHMSGRPDHGRARRLISLVWHLRWLRQLAVVVHEIRDLSDDTHVVRVLRGIDYRTIRRGPIPFIVVIKAGVESNRHRSVI